jgi:hypothetical protein
MDVSFDSQFRQTNSIKFYPYIGDKYNEYFPKILILGESHYISNELSPNQEEIDTWNKDTNTTREAVEEGYKPYKNTAAMLTNTIINNEWVYKIVAFYNFFQQYVGIGSSNKSLINDEMIDLSQKAYFSIIEILKPNLVIAWGTGKLYNSWVPQDECEILNEDNTLYRYKKYMETYIWHIQHPSAPMFNLFDTTYNFRKICEQLNISFPIKDYV